MTCLVSYRNCTVRVRRLHHCCLRPTTCLCSFHPSNRTGPGCTDDYNKVNVIAVDRTPVCLPLDAPWTDTDMDVGMWCLRLTTLFCRHRDTTATWHCLFTSRTRRLHTRPVCRCCWCSVISHLLCIVRRFLYQGRQNGVDGVYDATEAVRLNNIQHFCVHFAIIILTCLLSCRCIVHWFDMAEDKAWSFSILHHTMSAMKPKFDLIEKSLEHCLLTSRACLNKKRSFRLTTLIALNYSSILTM